MYATNCSLYIYIVCYNILLVSRIQPDVTILTEVSNRKDKIETDSTGDRVCVCVCGGGHPPHFISSLHFSLTSLHTGMDYYKNWRIGGGVTQLTSLHFFST